jgi:hypothetical protein
MTTTTCAIITHHQPTDNPNKVVTGHLTTLFTTTFQLINDHPGEPDEPANDPATDLPPVSLRRAYAIPPLHDLHVKGPLTIVSLGVMGTDTGEHTAGLEVLPQFDMGILDLPGDAEPGTELAQPVL